jgi:uncharacterized phage protein (TIGR02218 family)
MGFTDKEKSVEQGMPMQLLAFVAGSAAWRYATAAEDIDYNGNPYVHQPGLKCGKISIVRNVMRSRFEVSVPWSCPFVAQHVAGPPEAIVNLTVYRGHRDTATPPGAHDVATWWRGYVQSVTFGPQRIATIRCVPNYTDLGRGGLPLRYGRTCQVPLYSTACSVARASFATNGSADSVSGYTVTAAVFATEADGYWTGGELHARDYTRLIIAHSGSVVTLASTIPGLGAGATFVAYPGCDHLWASDCKATFANTANFRGQPHIPQINPNTQGVT